MKTVVWLGLVLFSNNLLSSPTPLEFRKMAPDVYVVVSQPYNVNSLLIRSKNGTVIAVDSPMTPRESAEVVKWSLKKWKSAPSYVFNSHWHFDATAGNGEFKKSGATIIASQKTNALLQKNGLASARRFSKSLKKQGYSIAKEVEKIIPVPADIAVKITESIEFVLGGEKIKLVYPGPSHSNDSIGVFFEERAILYGGCAVRSDLKLGNTSDADLPSWSKAMSNFIKLKPKIVIPGHGKRYDPKMLDETARITHSPLK